MAGLRQDMHDFALDRLRDFTGRGWLVERVQIWRADAAAPRHLIIEGGPGVGKSAFAAHLWLQRQMIDTVHFCIAGRGGTIEPIAFVRSISEQLLAVSGFEEALRDTQVAYSDQNIVIVGSASAGSVAVGGEVTGVRIENLLIRDMPPESAFERAIRQPLSMLAEQGRLQTVTILVDALDEAITYQGHPTILDLLVKADDLPRQVRFLLTTRQEPVILTWFQNVPHELINTQSEENQEDVRLFLEEQLAERELLRQTAQHHEWETGDFVQKLGVASEWNFLYLTLALPEIEAGRLLAGEKTEEGVEQEDQLPVGLNGIIVYLLNSRLRLEDWNAWGADLMESLLALREPASLNQIADLLAWPQRQTGGRLAKLAQLLDPALYERERYWRFHWSLTEFLCDRKAAKDWWCDLDAGHRHLAAYYLADLVRWPQHDGYAFRHLSAHLAKAKMCAEMGDLIEGRAWYEAQHTHDPALHAYAEDVSRALALAEARGLEALPHVVAWSLLEASVRTRATLLPIAALETMVLLGESERALRYAALITSPDYQSEAYTRIALRLGGKSELNAARGVLGRALAAAMRIPRDVWRAKALAVVAQAMTQTGDLPGALAVAMDISEESERVGTLAAVAQAMTKAGDLGGALAVIEKIPDMWVPQRVEALGIVAQAMAEAGDQTGAQQTLRRALAIEQHSPAIGDWDFSGWHTEALVAVARAMIRTGDRSGAQQTLERALAATEDMPDLSERGAEVIAKVVQAMVEAGDQTDAQQTLEQVLVAAEHTTDDDQRAEKLIGFTSALVSKVGDLPGARQTLRRALTLAKSLPNSFPVYRVPAVAGVAQAMAQVGDLVGALIATENIPNDAEGAPHLALIAQAMVRAGDRTRAQQVLERALTAVEHEPDNDRSACLLATVALAMTEAGNAASAQQVLDRALTAAEKPTFSEQHELALAAVAQAMAETMAQSGDLPSALAAAERIPDYLEHRALANVAVARAMTRAGDLAGAEQVLENQVLAIADWVHDYDYLGRRRRALIVVAQAMAQDGDSAGARQTLRRALAVAEKTRQGPFGSNAEALAAVAEAMAQAGDLVEALAVAENISDIWVQQRVEAFAAVAAAMAQAGDRTGAQQTLGWALAAAERIPPFSFEPIKRERALAAVAQAMAQAGDRIGAQQTLEQALAVATSTELYSSTADLAVLVRAMAQTGDLARASAIAENIPYDSGRAPALAAVAQAMAEAGDRNGAQQMLGRALAAAERTLEWQEPANALAVVVEAMVTMTRPGDPKVANWLCSAFAQARIRGREQVFGHIVAFAPVLAKLGVIVETWRHLLAVEALFSD